MHDDIEMTHTCVTLKRIKWRHVSYDIRVNTIPNQQITHEYGLYEVTYVERNLTLLDCKVRTILTGCKPETVNQQFR